MRETIEEQNQHIGRLMEDFVRRAVEFSNTLPDRPIRQPDPQEVMDYWPWRPRNGWRATQSGRWSLPAHFGIVNFQFAPGKAPDATWDQINQEMAREVTATGFAQVYTTQLRGRTVLRLCAINPAPLRKMCFQTIQRLESTQAAERGRRLAEEKGLQVG